MAIAPLFFLLAAGAGEDLLASPRTPALWLALADRGASKALFSAFSKAIAERTDLKLQEPPDPKALSACAGAERFTCWVRGTPGAAFLFVITAQADRASIMMIDLETARNILSSSTADPEDRENRLFEEAIQQASGAITLDDQGELERFAASVLDRELRSKLDRSGHFSVFGAIALRAPRPGLSISMDGKTLGATSEVETRIRDVRAGAHTLTLPELGASQNVEVEAGKISPVLFDAPAGPSSLRTFTLWGGVGLAAVGVIVEVAAIAGAGGSTHLTVCRGEGCSLDAPARFERAGPVLLAPLGYALAGAGGAFAGGALLTDPADEPWIALVAGGVVGALAYGLSAALEGGR